MESQELELLDGFRQLCAADRNTVITTVSMLLSSEEAARQEYELRQDCPIRGMGECQSTESMSSVKEVFVPTQTI